MIADSPRSSIAVEFQGISRSIGSCRAVDGVSAKFETGKIHAILGENGAGKTTLMKLLFGLNNPSSGSLRVDGVDRKWRSPADAIASGLGMVQQHFTLVETLSVIDNIMLGYEAIKFFCILDRESAILDLEKNLPSKALSLDWHRLVSDLSVGEKQKVEILKLIARKSKILVLDEPTAVLSPQETESLFEILKSLRDQGKTVFVITHKLNEVFNHCDTWFVLRAGRATGSGDVRTTNIDDVVRAMIGTTLAPMGSRTVGRPGMSMLKFSNVSVGVKQLRNVSFEVRAGEILGIAGVDGSGQSEIVNALLGLQAHAGQIEILGTQLLSGEEIDPSRAARILEKLRSDGLAIVSEDRHTQSLWLDESVEMNAAIGFEVQNGFVKRGWILWARWRATVAKWLQNFDVRFLSINISAGRLSGGNQQKLIFAREILSRNPKLIVAHQPTRGVDFHAIRLIHERILAARDSGCAALIISSELDELMILADRIVVLCAGRQTGEFSRKSDSEPFRREEIGSAMTDAGGISRNEIRLNEVPS